MNMMMTLARKWGRNMADARRDKGLTQQELSEVIGVSRRTIEAWEQGRRAPRDRYRAAIARVLDAKVTDLFPYGPDKT